MNREDACSKINEYAVNGLPFLFVTDFEGLNTAVLTMPEAKENRVFFRIGEDGNFSGNELPNGDLFQGREHPEGEQPGIGGHGYNPAGPFSFIPKPIDYEIYRLAFEKVSWHLKRGDTYLVNLTFPTELETLLSLREIFRISRAPYKLLFADHFTVFSPEPFIQIENGLVRSNPMKGTIDAAVPDAGNKLLNDRKEYYEHNTIVDLIRNDLAMISSGVKVERFRYVELIKTNRRNLLQMSSEISGRLPKGHWSHLGEDLFKLLPAGSVSGAPKEKTVDVIHEAENERRGFYTGVFGYFSGRAFSSAVMIRFIENVDGMLRFRSGGGITAMSDCESEYRELNDKVYVPLV